MSISDPSSPSEPLQDRLAAARSAVARARPVLAPDSDEYGAALLLLLSRDSGFNVDRLTGRSRLPREFVARCLRRLADNGWWVDGAVRCDWEAEGATADHFWLDVEVALGRRLRRVTEAGDLEWAPPHEGWVKEFEYASKDADPAIYNQYRNLARYDPEPVWVPGSEVVEAPLPAPSPRSALVARPAVGAIPPVFRPLESKPPRTPGRPVPVLIDAWGNADWLG